MSSLSWSDFRDKISRQAEIRGIPISGIFELTARCNLKCKMCYISKPAGDKRALSRERTAREWIELAKEARDAGMLYILLTGGEVFLRNDFREIYEEIATMGLIPTIYTNATLVTPEIIRWLGRMPPEKIEVTIYGASSSTYSAVCGRNGGYEKAVKGIDALLDAGINMRLKTTVIQENSHDYDALMRFAEDRDLVLHFCLYISPRRDEVNGTYQVCRLSPAELAAYSHKASKDFLNKYPPEKDISGEPPATTETDGDNPESSSPFKCSAGKRDFWITWDGRMVPCGLMEQPFTLPFESDFLSAWQELKEKFTEIPGCDACSSCSLQEKCIACPARLKNETGFYDRPADYLCEHARQQAVFLKDS